jgi:hypothetical protein
VLAASGWMGDHLRLLASSSTEVLDLLDSIPVRYVIVDVHASIQDADRAPHRLLREAILSRPDRFRRIASLPILLNGIPYDDALQVFENAGVAATGTAIRLPSSALASTGRLAHSGEWIPRAAATVDRDSAVAAILDWGADRLAALLRLRPPAAQFPPVRPSSDRVGPAGALGELLVGPQVAEAKVETSEPWIRASGADGPGARIVRYAVAANDSARERTGFISIGAVRVRVSQDGRP